VLSWRPNANGCEFRGRCVLPLFLQGPAQAQNIKDSLAEINSDIVVKVREASPARSKLKACLEGVPASASSHPCLYGSSDSGAKLSRP